MYSTLQPGAVGIEVEGLRDLAELAGRHGFGGVDLPIGEVVEWDEPTHAVDIRDAHGLRWGLLPLPFYPYGPEEDFQAGLEAWRTRFGPVARALGATATNAHLLPGHDEMDYRANWAFCVERLRAVADALRPFGVRHGIEFIGTATLRPRWKHEFIHTAREALALAREADPDGEVLGVALDTFHWYTSEGGVEDICALRGRVVTVHVNDARAGRAPAEQIDNERALPCETGVIDLAGFVGALREIDYDGPVFAEPFKPASESLAAMDRDEAAETVARSIDRMLAL